MYGAAAGGAAGGGAAAVAVLPHTGFGGLALAVVAVAMVLLGLILARAATVRRRR